MGTALDTGFADSRTQILLSSIHRHVSAPSPFLCPPLPIYDPAQRLAAFADSPFLFRNGDRVQFEAIDREEYSEIEKQVRAGAYIYSMKRDSSFAPLLQTFPLCLQKAV